MSSSSSGRAIGIPLLTFVVIILFLKEVLFPPYYIREGYGKRVSAGAFGQSVGTILKTCPIR
ncbi:hypothetical protein ACE6H2_002210 [Prunus campanulata]